MANYDLLAMCTGDFNGSLTTDRLKSTSSELMLATFNTKAVESNQEFDLPILAASSMEVGAISMTLRIPSNLAKIQDVKVNGSTTPVTWTVKGEELKIGWYSSMPVNVLENQSLITLKLKTTDSFSYGQSMELALKFDPLNELADGNFEVINRALLKAAKVGNGLVAINNGLNDNELSFSNYPNPFKNSTTVSYTLPFDGKVSIDVYNQLGQKITSLVDAIQQAGQYTIKMDRNSLSPGIYIAKLRLAKNDVNMVGSLKLSIFK